MFILMLFFSSFGLKCGSFLDWKLVLLPALPGPIIQVYSLFIFISPQVHVLLSFLK